ncbi:hypothetical protein RFI_33581 [Reticulomyxa filosa]|uniref:Phytase-like domain-containing protein n=1 Tax=Reticulomyxa filosa TaxID=46433 RepID=X6LQB7_RETFI|nr:hypothetical protein RFI_33581 [Reticulomyxa filosa]|eukprot:ETO03824.1 hypothetical protein RFI_33581 [Reticulomyxa filosa]
MIHNCLVLLFALTVLVGCKSNDYRNYSTEIEDIKKYKIALSNEIIKASKGHYTGIGSSLKFAGKDDNGDLIFYGLTDRAPNYPSNDRNIAMLYPQYSPKIVKIKVNNQRAFVEGFISIKMKGKEITGVPYKLDDSFYEVPLDKYLNQVDLIPDLDPESLAIDKDGNFVIGDEFFPSINIVNPKNGNIIRQFKPGSGLPKVLQSRQRNKGFEALSVSPNGKIYAALEGTLDINNETKDKASFIRIIEVDPYTFKVKMFAYLLDKDDYLKSADVSIGDMDALDNDHLLLIEKGVRKDGKFQNKVFKVDVSKASDISNLYLPNGKELEYGEAKDLKGIHFAKKFPVLDMKQLDWKENKLEGLAKVNEKTIAITNDNDFGINSVSRRDYVLDDTYEPVTELNKVYTELWIIKFKNKL